MNEKTLEELNVEYGNRPVMEPLDGVTDQHRKAGSHLAAIHRMHLRDVYHIGQLLEHVKAGIEKPSNLLEKISSAQLTDNLREFGTLCGRECQVLNFHHDAEETSIFPQLERQQVESLNLVVARLREEHLIVHELLDRLQTAASQLVQKQSDTNFRLTEAVFNQLTVVIKSHFGYEETELRDALGKFVNLI
jgi:hemerythrin superfamily protein